MVRRVLQIVLPLLLVAAGVGAAVVMVKKRPKADRKKADKKALVADIIRVSAIDHRVTVAGMGSVVPERTVVLQPRVSGTIVSEAKNFEVGGRVKTGDVLARIDDRDYKLQVAQRQSDVKRAEFEVKVERGRRAAALHEWKLLGGGIKATAGGKNLALRLPHKARVEASLAAANSALAMSKLGLERTVIKAPFDAIVRTKNASIGQLVGPGTPLATLVQTDRFLVHVSVPLQHLSWMNVPGLNAGPDGGSEVLVTWDAGAGATTHRKGRVQRLLGDLDPAGRMARITVSVDAPLNATNDESAQPMGVAGSADSGARPKPTNRMPLLLGSYVRAEIRGKQLPSVVRIPREAVREGDKVWLADKEDKLAIASLKIAWREREAVLASSGVRAGDRIIVSRVPGAAAGMPLRPRDVSAAKQVAGGAPKAAKNKRKPGGPNPASPAQPAAGPGDARTPTAAR